MRRGFGLFPRRKRFVFVRAPDNAEITFLTAEKRGGKETETARRNGAAVTF
jgi:hypothetical protein